jgi:predicted ATPase with chaperone activity
MAAYAGWGDTVIVIVGLSDAAVKESRDHVSTALTNSGFKFPMGRTTPDALFQRRHGNSSGRVSL